MSESQSQHRSQHEPFGGGPQGDEERRRREQAARTAQHDHTPRQEEQYARDRQQQRSGAAPHQGASTVDPRAAAEARALQAASSIGAQVILDYNSQAGLGARGGAAGTIEENTIARDEHLVALGLDPSDCSGPPPSPEQLAAKREREERQATEAETAPPPSPKATRMSSLAAGIAPDLPDTEPPPEGGNNGGQPATAPPVNRDVPHVTQDGATLNCTMGNWDGEPTSYTYQWKLDGGDVGDGSAAYAVQPGDAGKSATCVVTATNAIGSTAAPPSNSVVVTEPPAREA